MKLLIICGVHGGENGSYGGDASNFEPCMGQAVSITKYILRKSFEKEIPTISLRDNNPYVHESFFVYTWCY